MECISPHVATWLKVLDWSRADWCFSTLFLSYSSTCHFHSQLTVALSRNLVYTCAWLKCKLQCLKYCEFVRISRRYSLCLSICLALSHLILPVTPLRRVSNEVDCICSTADELLNSGKWTWWSLARSAYRGATVWKDDWCQEKNSKWLQASLCQCTKTLLTVKTFANVVWLHFKFRSTMQIILFFLQLFFFFFRIEQKNVYSTWQLSLK